jgi:hypothetical protein
MALDEQEFMDVNGSKNIGMFGSTTYQQGFHGFRVPSALLFGPSM